MSAAAGAGRDRLAVRERDVHGEVVAEGDWTVSDAERAAAGRETVTARFTALYREWAGGHDSWWWHTHLPLALAWLLTPGGSLAG